MSMFRRNQEILRPEDYSCNRKPLPSWCKKYNQYGDRFANHLDHGIRQTYLDYCSIDATQFWGWGVGLVRSQPVTEMGPWIPEKKKETEVAFFIDHIRQSTQWTKVGFLLSFNIVC